MADEERAYRIYVTDSLYFAGQGKALVKRYADLANTTHEEILDDRTGDEIARDVIERCGLKYECI